ncbi:MAG: PorP/SprF family type IX secretion system membrane protein [Flavobacteriaceae bacterium]
MIRKFYFLIALFFVFETNAQEGIPVYSDYLTDNLYLIHPSMAGASNCSKLRLTGRQQWFGVEDAPSLMTASFNTRFDEDAPSAAGIILFNDKNGYHSQTGAYVTYAHHIMLGRNTIDLNQVSFGLSVGVVQSRLDQSEWDLLWNGGSGFGTPDPVASSNDRVSRTYYNVDFGASYHFLDFYAHITIKNLMGTERKLYTEQESSNLQRFLISMGYVFSGINSDWSVEPSVMFNHVSETQETQFDVNAKVYKKMEFGKLWGGLSYRRSLDGAEYATQGGSAEGQKLQYITPFVGVNYDKYMFGYTYSHQTGQVTFEEGGYHQITLGINLNCRPEKYDCNCPGIN